MNIVLFFQSTNRKSWQRKLAGVYRFAREHDWFVQVVDRGESPQSIREVIANWRPIGCLVDRAMSDGAAPDKVCGNLPVVYLDQNPRRQSRRHPCLLHDSAQEAAVAGRELIDLGRASYAYVRTARRHFWDRERESRFRDDLTERGLSLTALDPCDLRQGIADLPKPCGILAANDEHAMKAFVATKALGLKIPEDVAIVGIDNDETYCESVDPGITSVEPDFEGAGYRLAQMLAEEIAARRKKGRRPRTTVEKYGPLRIERRGSSIMTDGFAPRIARAVAYIRKHALEPDFRLEGVVHEMRCSRALTVREFRKATGQSVLETVHTIRLNKCKDLLLHTTYPIATVVTLCGYESDAFIKKLFKRTTGLTMREWRKRNANKSLLCVRRARSGSGASRSLSLPIYGRINLSAGTR